MIVVDVETTGLFPNEHCIVSIGAVEFFNPENQFYAECRIPPTAKVSQQALDVNGFTREQITNPKKPSLEHAIKSFIEWASKIKYKTFAGQDPARFDKPFLEKPAKDYNLELPFGRRTLDLHSVSYSSHIQKKITFPIRDGKSDLSLDRTLEYVGMPAEQFPHNALNGAKLSAESFSRILYGKPLFEEFKKHSIPDYLK